MQEHQLRVVREQEELEFKLDKLWLFIKTDMFNNLDYLEQNRLARQHEAMFQYNAILKERINAFK
jgi:hypothetical protein